NHFFTRGIHQMADKTIQNMDSCFVHSTKYDGSLHYRYPTVVVQQDPDLLVLYGAYGIPLDSYRGQFPAIHHMLEFYWSERYYNLNIMWNRDWQPRSH